MKRVDFSEEDTKVDNTVRPRSYIGQRYVNGRMEASFSISTFAVKCAEDLKGLHKLSNNVFRREFFQMFYRFKEKIGCDGGRRKMISFCIRRCEEKRSFTVNDYRTWLEDCRKKALNRNPEIPGTYAIPNIPKEMWQAMKHSKILKYLFGRPMVVLGEFENTDFLKFVSPTQRNVSDYKKQRKREWDNNFDNFEAEFGELMDKYVDVINPNEKKDKLINDIEENPGPRTGDSRPRLYANIVRRKVDTRESRESVGEFRTERRGNKGNFGYSELNVYVDKGEVVRITFPVSILPKVDFGLDILPNEWIFYEIEKLQIFVKINGEDYINQDFQFWYKGSLIREKQRFEEYIFVEIKDPKKYLNNEFSNNLPDLDNYLMVEFDAHREGLVTLEIESEVYVSKSYN